MWDLARHGERIALVQGEEALTYGQLDRACSTIGTAIGERSLVFLLCSNTLGSVAGYLAFTDYGAVPLLLEHTVDAELLAALVERYRPSYLWVPDDMLDEFCCSEGDCGTRLRMETWHPALSLLGYTLLAADEPQPCPLHPDLAVLVPTSGTTGASKLVRLSYANIRANTASIIEYLGIGPDERAISSLPMSYVYGLSVLHTHIQAGASVALTELACYSGPFWKCFDEWECTSFAGVPFMYEMLDKLRFTQRPPTTRIKTMTQAGGRLSPELQDKFARFAAEAGVRFFVMYGASEATARMSYLPPERALDKAGSIGVAIPGGRLGILDEAGREVHEAGTSGELVYFGENVSLGYATCADDLAKGDERDGRLVTGDLARFDDEGFFYIVGRKARFVKMLGKRTALDEVEALVKARLDVVDVACSGRDNLICLFITDESLGEAAVSCVCDATGLNRKLVQARVIPEIPRNTSGKVRYKELEKLL